MITVATTNQERIKWDMLMEARIRMIRGSEGSKELEDNFQYSKGFLSAAHNVFNDFSWSMKWRERLDKAYFATAQMAEAHSQWLTTQKKYQSA